MKKLITNPKVRTALIMAVAIMAMAVPAFAAGETASINETLTSAFQTMVNDMMATAVSVLPIAMTILGLSVTVGFAVKWFKRLSGKA